MVFTCRAHWNFNSQWVKVLCVQTQPGDQEHPVLTPVLPLACRPEADAVCPNPKFPHLEMGTTALSRASSSEVLPQKIMGVGGGHGPLQSAASHWEDLLEK